MFSQIWHAAKDSWLTQINFDPDMSKDTKLVEINRYRSNSALFRLQIFIIDTLSVEIL